MGTAIIAKYSDFSQEHLKQVYKKGMTPKEHYAFTYTACGYYRDIKNKLAIWSPEATNGSTIRKSRVQMMTAISDKYPSMNNYFMTIAGVYTEASKVYCDTLLKTYSYPSIIGVKNIEIQLLKNDIIDRYGLRIIDPTVTSGINIFSADNGAWVLRSKSFDLTKILNKYDENKRYWIGLTMAKNDQKSDIETITLGKDIQLLIDGEPLDVVFNGQLDYNDVK